MLRSLVGSEMCIRDRLLVQLSNAQTNVGLEEQILQATSQLDLSNCASGIFINQSTPYVETSYLDGLQPDSLVLTASTYKMLYGMFDKGHIGTSLMPSTETFWLQSNEYVQRDTIELSGLFYQYHQFKETAIQDDLIEWDGTYFQDISSANQTPYEQNTLFAFSALRNQYYSKTVTFHFDANNFYSNINTCLLYTSPSPRDS